jgi:hypothetical protein
MAWMYHIVIGVEAILVGGLLAIIGTAKRRDVQFENDVDEADFR